MYFRMTGLAGAESKPEAPTWSTSQGITKSRSWRANIIAFVILLASSALMSGCGSILVTDRTPPPPAIPVSQRPTNFSDVPNTQETHDLAIAAVDFDPALDMQQIASGRPFSLLVAVENKGNRLEGPFTVSAQLLSQDRQQVLTTVQRTVSMLAPGDITLVRFPSDPNLPRQRAYILDTKVQAVPREGNTSNNQRVLEIQVSTGY
jgi:hypothetical protein